MVIVSIWWGLDWVCEGDAVVLTAVLMCENVGGGAEDHCRSVRSADGDGPGDTSLMDKGVGDSAKTDNCDVDAFS
jgi:hypothetical protein